MKIVWTIAGSDSSGGAGIQADLLTFQHLQVHGCSVITAATAQNANKVNANNFLSSEQIESQISALHETHKPQTIKIGMLGNVDTINSLKKYFVSCDANIVLDPVMVSSSGTKLFDNTGYIEELKSLLPYVGVITPNLQEAEALSGCKIDSYNAMITAANKILSFGVKNVVVKAGHFADDLFSHDYWANADESFWLSGKRHAQKNYRGTGCAFSSAIAASLANGHELKDALVIAKMYVSRGIRLARHENENIAYLHHANFPDDEIDLPIISMYPANEALRFPSCGELGLYPVVDNIDWLHKLLPLGVKTIQLRIKDKTGIQLEEEIKSAIALAKEYDAKLFINDYWELAITHNAYGVHLGQEDLQTADFKKIHAAGLRLGLSTHCFYEVARASNFHPSYLASGPIFATTSKIMPFSPQGIDKLNYWRKLLSSKKLVAIGGINSDNFSAVMDTGVDGIAMISAITKSDYPEKITYELLKHYEHIDTE